MFRICGTCGAGPSHAPGVHELVRVLHVIGSLDERMGGSVRAPLDISSAVVAAGHQATVIASRGPDDETGWLQRDYAAVQTKTFPRRFPRHYFHSPALRRWARRHVTDFDLIELHGIFTFPVLDVMRAAQARGVPYLVRPHGQLDPYDLRKHAQLKKVHAQLVVRSMLSGCHAVLATTVLEANRMVTFGTWPRIETVALPVLPFPGGSRSAFRQRFRIAERDRCVLFIGRFDRKKGLQFLVPAVAKVREQHRDVRLIIAGDGTSEEKEQLRLLLERNDASDWTTLTGFLQGPAKADAFAGCDIFALPSLNENFGIVAVEAMLAGLPSLLSTEVYVAPEPVAAGAALLCSPNEESTHEQLLRLLDQDLETMGTRAKALARDRFTVEASTARLLEIYGEVSNGWRVP